MNSVPEGSPGRYRRWVNNAAIFLLWLATAALGLVIVGLSREIVYGIYARFGRDVTVAMGLGQVVLFLFALVWLAYTIGTAEYHWRNAGKTGSWMVIAWATAIELLLLILYFVIAV
jgi:hypothetical protein